jgi:hypothetical protein
MVTATPGKVKRTVAESGDQSITVCLVREPKIAPGTGSLMFNAAGSVLIAYRRATGNGRAAISKDPGMRGRPFVRTGLRRASRPCV